MLNNKQIILLTQDNFRMSERIFLDFLDKSLSELLSNVADKSHQFTPISLVRSLVLMIDANRVSNL